MTLFAAGLALVSSTVLGVGACSSSKACEGSACNGAVTPVILVLSCDDSAVVQSSLTGPCSAGGLSCQTPDSSPLAGCDTATFTATGAGECDVQLTFANGFVYTGSFTFSEDDAGLVPSPEVVPVYCPPADAGAADEGTSDAAGDE
ncbi:MAG: hypothetical protein ABSE49_01575 [Polyangiaceae bacterium]